VMLSKRTWTARTEPCGALEVKPASLRRIFCIES
jgi:hypothetical protein